MADRFRSLVGLTVVAIATLIVSACQTTSSNSFTGERSTTTGFNPAYDFAPPENLVGRLPPVRSLTPLSSFAAQLGARISPEVASKSCNWVYDENFPAPQPGLVGYSSDKAFQIDGAHNPNATNQWFESLTFYSMRASSHILGDPKSDVREIFAAALLSHARARSALDTSRLVDARLGRPVATPDTAEGVNGATAITIAYLLVADRLPFTPEERRTVEAWLGALLTTFVDGYRKWHGEKNLRDAWLMGQAELAWGLLENSVDKFNAGVNRVLKFATYTREDGSHRFGASRGWRALRYQGFALSDVTDSLIILESQGLPARDVLLPTATRMSRFFARAWDDHSVLWPYAQENEGVPPNSDYRTQDKVQVPAGLDIIVALSPDQALVRKLEQIRSKHPNSTIYSETFNATCIAAGLRQPSS